MNVNKTFKASYLHVFLGMSNVLPGNYIKAISESSIQAHWDCAPYPFLIFCKTKIMQYLSTL